jgi:thymidine kinase
MDIITGNVGWIEVICGPMFSGKSEELIRRLRRAMIARKRVEVFKPTIDNRYSDNEIVSHGDLRMHSQVVSNATEITEQLDWRSEVIGIDEANFMGPQLVDVAQRLADSGKQVIISGLDTDSWDARSPPFRTCWPTPNPSPRRSPSACAAGTRPSTRNACADRTI